MNASTISIGDVPAYGGISQTNLSSCPENHSTTAAVEGKVVFDRSTVLQRQHDIFIGTKAASVVADIIVDTHPIQSGIGVVSKFKATALPTRIPRNFTSGDPHPGFRTCPNTSTLTRDSSAELVGKLGQGVSPLIIGHSRPIVRDIRVYQGDIGIGEIHPAPAPFGDVAGDCGIDHRQCCWAFPKHTRAISIRIGIGRVMNRPIVRNRHLTKGHIRRSIQTNPGTVRACHVSANRSSRPIRERSTVEVNSRTVASDR